VASRHRGRGDSLLADRDREAPRRESGALPHRSSEGRERRRDHHALAARLTRAELVASCPSDLGPRQHGARRALTMQAKLDRSSFVTPGGKFRKNRVKLHASKIELG